MVAAYSRDDFVQMSTEDLIARRTRARDRLNRSCSTEAWMVDAFIVLEINVALALRGVAWEA